MADQFTGADDRDARRPRSPSRVLTILLPVLLMLLAALAQATLPDGAVRRWVGFAGSPLMAMLLATLLALYTFGRACGFDRDARAALRRGVAAADRRRPARRRRRRRVRPRAGRRPASTRRSRRWSAGLQLSPLVLGWVIAALLRLAVGSATVSVRDRRPASWRR